MSYKWVEVCIQDFDYRRIPVNYVNPLVEEERLAFNELLTYIDGLKPLMKNIVRTSGKGLISKNIVNWLNNCYMPIVRNQNEVNIYMHLLGKGWALFIIKAIKTVDERPYQANYFNMLKELINEVPAILDQKCDNEAENEYWHVKAKEFYNSRLEGTCFFGIPSDARRYNGKVLEHVYSLDFHKAFPTMLSFIVPEAIPWKNKVRNGEIDKIAAVAAIGCMTSDRLSRYIKGIKSRGLARLRYKILEQLAYKVNNLKELLELRGCTVLNLRTDSIKFIVPEGKSITKIIATLPGKGDLWDLEWNDQCYIQCSTGKYAHWTKGDRYIKPTLNGRTRLDYVKPREEWTLEDFLSPATIPVQWGYNRKLNQLEVINN